MKILFLGDVNGRPGRQAVADQLPELRKKHKPDIVIANAENSAGGFGATAKTLQELQQAGVEAFTMGDHSFDRGFEELLDFPIVRPANFEEELPGEGARLIETATGKRLLLVNLIGFAFLKRRGTNYFTASDELLQAWEGEKLDAIFVDFHAEATSEKTAMGYHLDGRVSALVGTHTHVPTADEHILPQGTAYITDVGMCGASESVIGVSPAASRAFLEREMGLDRPKDKAAGADNPPYTIDAVVVEIEGRGKAKSIKRVTTR